MPVAGKITQESRADIVGCDHAYGITGKIWLSQESGGACADIQNFVCERRG